jgi:hypothetical protein
MKKTHLTDAIFIVLTGVVLLVIDELNWLEELHAFILIPILAAYFIGKWAGAKVKDGRKP